jgi:hypothetical protein
MTSRREAFCKVRPPVDGVMVTGAPGSCCGFAAVVPGGVFCAGATAVGWGCAGVGVGTVEAGLLCSGALTNPGGSGCCAKTAI